MVLSSNSQAILLLTAHFTEIKNESVKPLTSAEWGRFAAWLKKKQLTPYDVNTENLNELLAGWDDKSITADRLGALIRRGSALALAVEKWQRSGIWIMTRSDSDYPQLLKQRLKSISPPVLFGYGNRDSLDRGGLAVVGSRKANEQDIAYSRAIGAMAASKRVQVISGGARGVDEAAMLGALQNGGDVIGVISEGLIKACRSSKYREFLTNSNLVLVSPFYPEAGFSVGQAMYRNKFIYCLSNAGVVVHTETKGGTWTGAMENLKKNWVPLWVKKSTVKGSGNEKVFQAGANWVPNNEDEIDINIFVDGSKIPEFRENVQPDEIASQGKVSDEHENTNQPTVITDSHHFKYNLKSGPNEASSQAIESTISIKNTDEFYELFLAKVKILCKDVPKSREELASILPLQSTQLKTWLKKAIDEGKLKRNPRPVSYQWLDQGRFFSEE